MTHDQEDTVSPITDWLTTGQVARLLGVSSVRVIQLANERRLEHMTLGNGMRLFDPEAVALEAARRRASQ